MAKKVKVSNKRFYILATVLLVSLGLFLVAHTKNQSPPKYSKNLYPQQNSPTPTPTMNTYHSRFLKSTISIPAGFSVEERFGILSLKKDGNEMIIHRIGTNHIFSSTDEFLDETMRENPPTVNERRHVIINKLDSVMSRIEYKTHPEFNSKAYYFHINNGFYDLYTESTALYTDLDQVAQSFRYEP